MVLHSKVNYNNENYQKLIDIIPRPDQCDLL